MKIRHDSRRSLGSTRDRTALGISLAVALTLASCVPPVGASSPTGVGASASAAATSKPAPAPKRGGTLRIANPQEPPTLDPHFTTTSFTRIIGSHMFEELFTLDQRSIPAPLLADAYTPSADLKTHTIKLRRGVKFHDGTEMTSADVVASLRRWGELAGDGRTLFKVVDSLTAVDAYTVELKTKTPYASLLDILAARSQLAVVLPKAIAEAAGKNQLKNEQLVGTGPYRFAAWEKDKVIRLSRFDGYVARSDAPNGYTGKREALLDTLEWIAVPDPNTRVAGLQTGQYHHAIDIPVDLADVLKQDKNVELVNPEGSVIVTLFFNGKSGPFAANLRLRQAAAAALDPAPVLSSTYRGYFSLVPGLMDPSTFWRSDAGVDFYNKRNVARARQLAQDAGYKGEAIRMMAWGEAYQMSLVVKQQLEEAGFKVELRQYDLATYTKIRNDPGQASQWDALVQQFSFRADPSTVLPLNCNWPATGVGWCSSEKDRLMAQFTAEADPQKRLAVWEQVQNLIWAELPYVKIGNYPQLTAHRSIVKGYTKAFEPLYWGVWLDQ